MYQRILVPVDGSHTSTLGLQEAIRIAIDQRARLKLISVIDGLIIAQNFEGMINAKNMIDFLREASKKAIGNALALIKKHDLKAEASTFETVGDRVAEVIVREAKKWKADLIVMGTHGRRGFNRLVLGSDAEGVLRSSPVPVLMVRSPASRARRKK
jgi:nucleotide-binding universal stress UspA family protein